MNLESFGSVLEQLGLFFEASAKVVREPADRSCHSSRTIGPHMRTGQSQRRAIVPFSRTIARTMRLHVKQRRTIAPILPSDCTHPADRSPIMPIDRPHLPIDLKTAPIDRQTAQLARAFCRSIAQHSRSIAQCLTSYFKRFVQNFYTVYFILADL